MKKDIHLSWVLVNSELHHVKEYSHLISQQRPDAYCPVCKSRVVMKLGPKKVFHAAHKADDNCPATNPETALHLNAKLHIAQQLQRGNCLVIDCPCDGESGGICRYEKSQQVDYLLDWDDVKVEYFIDQYRPDIVLFKDGLVIGAIEVFVTHSIEPNKQQYLENLSIPWVEVAADKIIFEDDRQNWVIESPIPYQKFNASTITKWLCSSCEDLVIAKQYITTAFRVIDFYYPNHKHYRSIYYAKKSMGKSGAIYEIRIEWKDRVLCSVKSPVLPEGSRLLNDLFMEQIRSDPECLMIDAHMRWQQPQGTIPIELFDDSTIHSIFPKRYRWQNDYQDWQPILAFQKLDWNEYFYNREKYLKLLFEKVKPVTL